MNFNLKKEFKIDDKIREGWGLCRINYENNLLYLTDGTNKIFKMDIKNNKIWDIKEVYYKNIAIYNLNECELINNEYYLFNVFLSNKILKLNKNLEVIDEIDFSLLNEITNYFIENFSENKFNKEQSKLFNLLELNSESLFNGIAYDNKRKVIYLTGKNWPLIFEIKLI